MFKLLFSLLLWLSFQNVTANDVLYYQTFDEFKDSNKNDLFVTSTVDIFKQQCHLLYTNSNSDFGSDFIKVDPKDGFKSDDFYELYYLASLFAQTYIKRDVTQRPIIESQKSYNSFLDYNPDIFLNKFNLSIHNIPKSSGFFFKGIPVAPEKIREENGLWSSLFKESSKYPGLRSFQEFLIDKKGVMINYDDDYNHLPFDLQKSFDTKYHLRSSSESILSPLTKSIYTAKSFAFNMRSVKESYIYVFYVANGFDIGKIKDDELQKQYGSEQEVSAFGVLPYANLVAYRKMALDPSKENKPDFVGPIYVRSKLQDLEPEAYKEIVQNLSVKIKE